MSLDKETLFSKRLPVAKPLPTPPRGVQRDSDREVLLQTADQVIADIDEVTTPPVHTRNPQVAGNILGLAGAAYHSNLHLEARDIELDRGAEGFSPEAVASVYPDGVLCRAALKRIVDGYRAWNDNALQDTELCDW